jgi:hypothetical protein
MRLILQFSLWKSSEIVFNIDFRTKYIDKLIESTEEAILFPGWFIVFNATFNNISVIS